jgi:hypothetical protein
MWILYALLNSLFRAMFVETARFFPGDGWVRTFWQAVFGMAVLLPFLPFMEWSGDRDFYLAAVGTGMITTVGHLLQLGLAARQRGRVTPISMPVETCAAFLIWVLLAPSVFEKGVPHDVLHMFAVAMAFQMAVVALLIIRPNDINLRTILLVAPTGFNFAVAAVVMKLALPVDHMFPAILTFALINFTVMSAVMALALGAKRKVALAVQSHQLVKGGLIAGLFAAASYVTFAAGVVLAPNPGYVSFMIMLLPVWMIGLHRLFGAEERASPVAALLLVISTAILIFAVN